MKFEGKRTPFLIIIGLVVLSLFLARPALALSPAIRQVKTPDSPGVYYLNHTSGRSKAYLNAAAYLSYGNAWSEVRVISSEELAKWPTVELVKTADSPDVYYIKGGQKALIASSSDLTAFALDQEPIQLVNQIDLDQYALATYSEIGLVPTSPSNPVSNQNLLAPAITSTLNLSFDPVTNNNNNSILAGTNSNLIGILKLQADDKDVEISTLKIDLTGVYNSDLVDKAYLATEDYKLIENHSHFSGRQLGVSFPDKPFLVSAGQTRTLRIFVNLKPCTFDCTNQTIRTEIKSANNIISNAAILAALPITSNYLKLVYVPNLLGQPQIQELPLTASPSGPSLLLGKFQLSETTGQADVYLKELTLANLGSAGSHDLKTFRLQMNNTIIARTSEMTDGDKIVFKINYCRLSHDEPLTLSVFGQKTDSFAGGVTLNLDVDSAWVTNNNFNASLNPVVNNLEEIQIIN